MMCLNGYDPLSKTHCIEVCCRQRCGLHWLDGPVTQHVRMAAVRLLKLHVVEHVWLLFVRKSCTSTHAIHTSMHAACAGVH
jgi:hypothetical protein